MSLLFDVNDVIHIHVSVIEVLIMFLVWPAHLAHGRDCALAVDHLDVACIVLHLSLLSADVLRRACRCGGIVIIDQNYLWSSNRWLYDLISDVDLSEAESVAAVLLVGLRHRRCRVQNHAAVLRLLLLQIVLILRHVEAGVRGSA